ncbi:BON1-associated protein 2 [Senna tora]|uniref:BON1-associated protein 2 n=1 Tax=Senna tora TaxID=362788 RepID=A0A834WNT8_9FABA|nr:BON1-associated protein 2 [Senna tora]
MSEPPSPTKMQQVLEINLISAQGLKPLSSARRKQQTYAVTWVDPSTKLRTRVDQIGGENPTWNDKFLFRVTPEFLASETSAVCVAIYSVGLLRDSLVGTVRFLISNILDSGDDSDGDSIRTPTFCAVQIRRPSGSFHGVMNIGAMVLEGSDFPALNGISAIGRDYPSPPNPNVSSGTRDVEILITIPKSMELTQTSNNDTTLNSIT